MRHYHPIDIGVDAPAFQHPEDPPLYRTKEKEMCVEPIGPDTYPLCIYFTRTGILLNITLADHRRLCSTLCTTLGDHIRLELSWPFPDCFRYP